jgi:hypothetical protein
VFDQDRYFDVFVEYVKASPEDMLIQITVHNRGPEPATLRLLPTLWFRNDWSWEENVARPTMRQLAQGIRSRLNQTLKLKKGVHYEWIVTGAGTR